MTFLRHLLLLTMPFSILAVTYKVTPTLYPALSNHEKVCQIWYGEHTEVADFYSDIKPMNNARVEALMDELEIKETTNEKYFFVTYEGHQLFSGKHAYFFENHGGPAPSYFPTVDSDDGLTLGVTNHFGHVLCKLPELPPAP